MINHFHSCFLNTCYIDVIFFTIKNVDGVFQQHCDGLVNIIKTKNNHRIVARTLNKGIHVFDVDLVIVENF
jgi:hypothetical protein